MSNSASFLGLGKVGRPVKYAATRAEAILTDYQGRDLATTVGIGARARTAGSSRMRADNISNVGARCRLLSPLGKGAGLITG